MTITEKVAYIKGLAEGLKLDETKPEGKVISEIIKVLEDMAMTVSDTEERVEYLEGYADELDDDLALLEDEVYGDEEDDDEFDCEDCDEECETCCKNCCDDDEECCVACPHCGEDVYLDEDMDFDCIKCPSCGKEFSCVISDDEADK
ncbi:MAG: hypothetical protein MJ101_03900 [Clostridia bacterium]|nr:hypothetical protein [Clostridia bacterium]